MSQVAKVEGEDHKHDSGDDGGGCELSLSLSLQHHPSSQTSTSEISSSEAFSSYPNPMSNYIDCSGFSKPQLGLNLDLSIALCGN